MLLCAAVNAGSLVTNPFAAGIAFRSRTALSHVVLAVSLSDTKLSICDRTWEPQ
jgi:hypothetical protein